MNINGGNRPASVTVAAIITLGVIVVVAIIGLTLVALQTKRDLRVAEGVTAGTVILIAALGGIVFHRRSRRKHNGDDT